MKIDITSMFFNSRIEGQTATPAWGTSIGQNKSRDCRIDDFKQEVVDMVIGMTYKSVADLDNLDTSKGSSDRDIITCAVFEDVFINNMKVDNGQYVLLLVREHSKSHDGRLLISYAPYIKYNNIANQSCIDLMQKLLGCSSEGCWFVYDISIKNQSELYFSAVVVNPSAPMVYKNNVKSKNRSEEWKALIPADTRVDSIIQKRKNGPIQQIYYGAPGTGKSHEIKSLTKGKEVIRTTFHPDSDYSTFVGSYKPTTIEVPMRDVTGKVIVENGKQVTENRIIYEFVEQAFLQAYTRSWIEYANTEEGKTPVEVYLVIEEINRGNCAQIFGDLFQLLDRGEDGFSEYPIVADKDLQKQLAKAFADMPFLNAPSVCGMSAEEVAVKIRKGEILLLPNNLFIWATMNTSDQSLFPIDSAFKRRWDWQYMPIANGNKGWRISANGNEYDWWEFLEKINALIGEKTSSEDKKLGYYFCKAKDGVIDAKMFVGKVIFYLWNDVFKDYEFEGDAFNDVEGKLTFDKFYKTIDGTTTVVEEKVVRFMENLNVNPIDDQEEDEDGNMKSSVNKNYDKFSINDNGNWGKNRLAFECIKEYVSHHEEKAADEVLEIWGKMNPGVPHFIESDDVYNNRTDTSKIRSSNIKWSNGSVYVVRNGYGSNGMVEKFMKNVNDNYELLGQKIKRIVNQ